MIPPVQVRTLLIAIALLSTASIAAADETATGSARPARDGQAVQGNLSPELVKRTAEATAATRPELRRAPMTKAEKTIFDIQELGRTQVAELQKQIEPLAGGPARHALEIKVIQVKRDTEVQVLRALSAQALQRGDIAGSRAANDAIEMILHPKAPQTTMVPRSAPGAVSNQ
ncbi:MAG: hypothetical protein ABIU54_14895 [Candidatus Eisenbacteria bacterium]